MDKERQLTAMICGDGEPVTDLGFDEEVMRYHYTVKPQTRTDIIFLRDDDR